MKFVAAIIFILLSVYSANLVSELPAFAVDFMWGGRGSLFRRPPAPHLVFPIYDEVTLREDYLEFKWWNTFRGIDRYEFRLYKGYEMYNDNLILKKTLPFNAGSIKVEAQFFENNQVYTWSLIQVADSGEKSEKSFISFRVIKK